MTPRRRLLSATCAALSLVGLAACEKPLPLVTMVSGTQSVYTEASTFCDNGQSVAADDCRRGTQQPKVLRVRGGDAVAVSVAKVLSDRTWLIALSDPQAAAQGGQATEEKSPVQNGDDGHDHYFSFTAPALPESGSVLVTVRALGAGDEATGEWKFLLKPRA